MSTLGPVERYSPCIRVVVYLLLMATHSLSAQAPHVSQSLVGICGLVSVEQHVDRGKPVAVPSARGLLVFDNAGHMFAVSTDPR